MVSAEGKASSKRKRQSWEVTEGWQGIDVGNEVLLGASEGGFCSLEEFTPPEGTIIGPNLADVDEPSEQELSKSKAKGKLKASSKGSDASTEVKKKRKLKSGAKGQELSLEEMQIKLAQAETENAKLRSSLKAASATHTQPAAQKPGSTGGDTGEKKLNHAQRKKLARKAFKAAKRDEFMKQMSEKRKAARAQKRASAPSTDPNTGGNAVVTSLEEPERTAEPERAEQASEKEGVDGAAWRGFDLEPEILSALAGLGFQAPTPIQQECLPAAIRDWRDVIGAAQTGSGKTLAFGLPIIQALLHERKQAAQLEDEAESEEAQERKLRALILAPTRELALQVTEHLQAVAKPCSIWVVPIVGGIAAAKQERQLRVKPEVVVATPGRLWELMRDGNSHLTDMHSLAFLVLDEADRMVQQGHFEELSSILDYVPTAEKVRQKQQQKAASSEETPEDAAGGVAKKARKLQTFVFSATLTLPESLRRRLRRGGGGASGSVSLENLMEKLSFGHKPKIADLTSQRKLADKVAEAYLECSEEDRDERLYYVLTQHPGRTLVFANAISTVRRLAAILQLLQLPAVPLHASMQQRQRLKALDKFRASESAIMVATDVAARGLDIPDVASVVHYQIPAAVDVYVHRCGRTARASAEGISLALVAPKESLRFRALFKAMDREPPPLFPLDQRLLPGSHKRVRLAVRLSDSLNTSSKKSAEKTWERQAAAAAGIDLSDEEAGPEPESLNSRVHNQKEDVAGLKEELAVLLREPLQPRYSQRFFTGAPSAALARAAAPQLPPASQEAPAADQDVDVSNKDKDQGAKAKPDDELVPFAVSQAVQHAKKLAHARSVAALKPAKGKKAPGKGTKQAALQAAVEKHLNKKAAKKLGKAPGQKISGGQKSRFVVIPGAVPRETQGANALQALREHNQDTAKRD